MKILHTADWHLADRLGRIDRTQDLRKAVENVATICEHERVDVLLIAGDIFSDRAPPDALQETIGHLGAVFRPFLQNGGTIAALTGNHDNEIFCKTLREAFRLVAPTTVKTGDVLPAGRLHLHTGPTHFRLADRAGQEVQFVMLPYPTGSRYLDDPGQRFQSIDERHRAIRDACEQRLAAMQQKLDPTLPSVLAAHFYVGGTALRGLFRLTEQEDIVFQESTLSTGWTYAALGHIHQPQSIGGMPHVRYSGSIERMDQGEREDEKSVTLLEIGPAGLRGEPQVVPLNATPFYDVHITNPQEELSQLPELYPDAETALARLQITYHPGEDNLPGIYSALDRIFPRWYDRTHQAACTETEQAALDDLFPISENGETPQAVEPEGVVLQYLQRMLADEDEDREEMIAVAQELFPND